jgi:hypothetical protein
VSNEVLRLMHEFNEPLVTAWQLVAGADARLAG